MRLLEAIQECAKHEGFGLTKRTIEGYNRQRLQFCIYLHNPHIEEVKESDVTGYFRLLLECGWAQNGVQHYSIAIRNLLSYWKKRGRKVLDPELIPIPKREFKMPRVAEYWQYQAFLDSLPTVTNDKRHPRNRALAMLLYDTGARCNEVLMLNIKDLDFSNPEQGRAIIKTEKSQGRRPIREIFWTPETTMAIRVWLEAREELKKNVVFADPDALFVGVRCWQTGMRITVGAVDMMFRKQSRIAGIPPIRPHMLRHLKGHDLNDEGANNSTISGILGHSSLQSSYIYTMMNSKELQQAAFKYNKKRAR